MRKKTLIRIKKSSNDKVLCIEPKDIQTVMKTKLLATGNEVMSLYFFSQGLRANNADYKEVFVEALDREYEQRKTVHL